MSEIKLTVLVLNYNGGRLLVENVRTLWTGANPTWEIGVIDNASSDESIDVLNAALPEIPVLHNSENIGFAAAINKGLAKANGQYMLLLNPDVTAEPGAVATAVAYMDEHPDVAILGPKIILSNGKPDPTAHRSFKTPSTYFYKLLGLSKRLPKSRFGKYYMTNKDLSQPCDVDSVTGAFLLIRASAEKQIGPLDERFFMYCEDEDWCWRAKQAGWRVVYNPNIVVNHAKGSSAKQHPIRMTWVWHISLLKYHKKNIAPRYSAVVNAIVYAGIGVVMAFRIFGVAVLRLRPR